MWNADQLEIRTLAREFAEGELRPRSAEWDEARAYDGEVLERLAELGFLGMRVPDDRGGLGLDAGSWLLALEELARGDASVALTVAVHDGPVTALLARHGTPEQKARLLPDLAAGERLGAFALAEPEAGGDPEALRTRAARADGGWRLTGTKSWITNGDRADLVVVFARLEGEAGEAGAGGVGAFLVDRECEGYRVTERPRTSGFRASETVHVRLDGVHVPEGRLLGGSGAPARHARDGLDVARVGVAAVALGIARAALEHATEYATGRRQFGRAIGEFGGIREKLADMTVSVVRARALVHEAGRLLDPGAPGEGGPSDGLGRSAVCAAAGLTAAETAARVAREAVQIYGGYGYMRDYPVEKLMRDAKGTEICFGTNELLREVVARDVLGPSTSP